MTKRFLQILMDVAVGWRLLVPIYLFLAVFYVPMIFYRRYIGSNKRGLYIRMNGNRGQMVRLEQVKQVTLKSGLLALGLADGQEHIIDLDEARAEDSLALENFLRTHNLLN